MTNVDNYVETPIIKEIKDAYDAFRVSNGCEPRYAKVMAKWCDNDETFETTIVVNGCDALDDEDDIIFFCNSINDLISLTIGGGIADFLVVEFFGFYN